ncbi:competence type IV pilus ATPase ComGA [Fructilactobacillus sanfranciscensis]|uniref:competence type IV pilus ATPase ComGA n=1 Tax=Fructilactobacillus sanfranciscensis TaxID=1625 RepID=UPI001CDB8BB4|nr:competence type IV pilus ATPase ComGA [Fructilactobacillus sanfranciscensis]
MEISNLFDQIIELAVQQRASYIYFLPKSTNYEVKIHTVKGVIQLSEISFEKAQRIITFCKYQSGMSVSEKRRPQLGSLSYEHQKLNLRIRLSSVGTFNHHESLVMRIIYDNGNEDCQFFEEQMLHKLKSLSNQRGLMIFSGPTGSGKTSTIYKIARSLHENEVIMSIEDPVEIFEDRFLQLEVNEKADMSYANLLKVGLRQRPDVFIIGEIRDEQTAKIAVRAALSGHLVFTTVHAKTPAGVVQRMLELGIKYEQLKSATNSIVYQRLLPTNSGNNQALISVSNLEMLENQKYDMEDWKNKLCNLYKEGKISSEIQKKYQFG